MPGERDGFAADAGGGWEAGSLVAGYRLEERIGQGGMAVIFRARDERLGRLVALKILAPALAADNTFRRRFIGESRASAAVDDPHIIPVFGAGEAGGVLFIAMRYVPGGDAGSLVRRDGPLPAGRAAAIISAVASALDAAHGAGLVHRDVKPSNMLMDVRPGRPDHVYLSDFGLSKAALASTGLTGTGTFLGTVDYIAPEQIQGRPVDGRADQYALACAAFELLTGQPPFRRDDVTAVMYAQLSEPPPALTARRPDLPVAADQVVARAMAKAPADRYPSCREFADALRTALGMAPYAPGPKENPGPAHPPTDVVAVPTEDTPIPPPRPPYPDGTGGPSGGAGAGRTGGSAGAGRTGDGGAGRRGGSGGAGTTGGGARAASGAGASSTQGSPPVPLWRRRSTAVLAGIAVLTVAGVVAGILLAGSPAPGPVIHHPAGVQIAATSRLTPVSGAVYVGYHDGHYATAHIRGQVKGAARGEVAGLYAQPFPYARPPARAGVVVLGSQENAPYTFTVTPVLATRYTVRVFPDRTAKTAVAHSPAVTVYVGLDAVSNAAQACARPVCHQTFHVRVLVPAAALGTEMSKRWYPYLGLALAPSRAPAAPTWERLDQGAARVTGTHRISATEFGMTITFSFRIGNQAYSWNWSACSQDTEAENGVGLPGHHGCGTSRLRASDPYIG